MSAADRDAWFHVPVVVEEKLDGANVCLWLDGGTVRVASRGGSDAMDRAGQLGRLRAWVGERHDRLAELLGEGLVAYGEWLWLEHSVHYDRLPDWLVLLDVWSEATGMRSVHTRNHLAARHGLVVPPALFEGVLGGRKALLGLMGTSRFGSKPMEGVVLRREDGTRCKVIRPGFSRRTDDSWGAGRTNILEA